MNTALLLRMGKRSRSTTIENGVRLLMSLRRCSCTSNLQLFSIHAGFHDPAFFVPAFGTGSKCLEHDPKCLEHSGNT